jgi:hypothetical protein
MSLSSSNRPLEVELTLVCPEEICPGERLSPFAPFATCRRRQGVAPPCRRTSEMCMNRDVLYVLKVTRPRAADSPGGRPVRAVGAVALFATGIWWVILRYGSRGIGWPIDDIALLLPLGGIFLILLLVLGLATTANDVPMRVATDGRAVLSRCDVTGAKLSPGLHPRGERQNAASREKPERLS